MARLFDANCPTCGINEVIATADDVRANAGRVACGYCGAIVPQYIGPRHCQYIRIDAGGEDSTDPKRIADGTAGFNLGLKGRDTVIGRRPDGKPRLSYRPLSNAELGSNRAVREEAKKQGLTLAEGSGRFRTVGR